MMHVLLQVVSETPQIPVQSYEELKLISLLGKGGWLMVPIAFLAVLGVYLFIERYLLIKKSGEIDSGFMFKIRDLVVNGNIKGAMDLCSKTYSPVARMIEKGIARLGNPLKDISISIENTANLEVFKLEKRLPILATIAGAAPMLGFLGTVTGMISAFYRLSTAGNNIDPGMLAGGIYEAMVTTASGLAVGILTYVGYNILTSMVKKVVFKMEATSVEFIDMLHEPA
jgi:biopolymer transport protein ExbB